MVWQKVTRHISDHRVQVESKSENEYPVDVTKARVGNDVYQHFMNEKNTERRDMWAWVEFEDGEAKTEWVESHSKDMGCPDKPPWEHP